MDRACAYLLILTIHALSALAREVLLNIFLGTRAHLYDAHLSLFVFVYVPRDAVTTDSTPNGEAPCQDPGPKLRGP